MGVLYYRQLKNTNGSTSSDITARHEFQRHSSQPASNIVITRTQDVMNKQLNLENLPCPEIHRSVRTQGIMTGEWRGQNLRKTVGECEIEVGRNKHMHEMRQCSSVLLVGGRMLQSLRGVSFYQWKAGSVSSVLLFCWFFFLEALSVSFLSVCHSSELPAVSCASHALLLMWACRLCVSCSLLTLSIHTLTLSVSLARFLIAHPFSVSSALTCPPPPFSFSLMLSLSCSSTHIADTVRG